MALQINRIITRMGAIAAALLLTLFAFEAFAASTWLSSVPCDVPTRIALDAQGNIYVTEAREKGDLMVFDRNGKQLRTLSGLKNPAGVALDAQGRIYIVNQNDKSVDIYANDFTYMLSLGAGKGEFNFPHSVVIANGKVYVSDTKDNKIKVYNDNGTFAFSFGGFGRGNGQFNSPLGLAIDSLKSELYVLDWGIYDSANGPTAGARVQVFDLLGMFLRSFGQYGSGEGYLMRPLDIALDRDSRVYIADGFQNVVEVFDGYGIYKETIYDAAHPTKTPIGVAVGRDDRVFIASANQKNIEVFGVTGYTTMDVSPATLSFTAVAAAGNPTAQNVAVVNTGSGTLSWTAAADKPWITLTPVDNATLTVGINATGLVVNTYSGTVTLTATTGAVATVVVQLTVVPPPPVLAVTPASMNFNAQQNGAVPAGQTIDIRNLGGGTMTWTASSSQPWLKLSALSGTAPSQILATINTALPVGTQTAQVTVAAPGALSSPAVVNVTVTVSNTGTLSVTTNLSQAQFTVTGPAPSTTAVAGNGASWTNSNAAPGTYTVAFGHVQGGYITPPAKTVTVTTGKATDVSVSYAKKPVMTHLLAVSGTAQDKKVTVLTVAGDPVTSFKPFDYPVADVQAAAGDLDGSGSDKIVVCDGVRTVKVFNLSGTELGSLSLPRWNRNATIAVGDIDNDGKADLLVGSLVRQVSHTDVRQVQQYSMATGTLEAKAMLLSEEGSGAFSLAIGDVNGDLANELVLADKGGIRAYSLSNGVLGQLWSVQGTFAGAPLVATGDLDDDGAAEIILSMPGVIQVLKGTGELTSVQIATPKTKTNSDPASIASGDVDGDGADEIAVGSVAGLAGAPTVQFYKGTGSASGAPIEIKNTTGSDVNVSLGRL